MDRTNRNTDPHIYICQNSQWHQAKMIKVSGSLKAENPPERRHMLDRVDTLDQDNTVDDPGKENFYLSRSCKKNYTADSSQNQQETVLWNDEQSMDGQVCLVSEKDEILVRKHMPVLECSPMLQGETFAKSAAAQRSVNQTVLKMEDCSAQKNACAQEKYRGGRDKKNNREQSGANRDMRRTWEGNSEVNVNRQSRRCSNAETLVSGVVDLSTDQTDSFNLDETDIKSHADDLHTRSQGSTEFTQSSQQSHRHVTQARTKQSRNMFTRTNKYKDNTRAGRGEINQIKMGDSESDDNETVQTARNPNGGGFRVLKDSKSMAKRMMMQCIEGPSAKPADVEDDIVQETHVGEMTREGLTLKAVKDFQTQQFSKVTAAGSSKLDNKRNHYENFPNSVTQQEFEHAEEEAVFAKRPSKRNVNTNAHGDPTTHTTIITTNKPTHGSQKFLVRKDKQWNAGDGCDPSYVIHIESQTDQAASGNVPSWATGASSETRRRRGDIIKMKRMENESDKGSRSQQASDTNGGLTTSRSCFSEIHTAESSVGKSGKSSNDTGKTSRRQSYPSTSAMINDFETLSCNSKLSSARKDRRNNARPGLGKASSRSKTEEDNRSFARTSRCNVSMRLIDHLEMKEVHQDRAENNCPKVDELSGQSGTKSGNSETKELEGGLPLFEFSDHGQFPVVENVTMLNPCTTAAAKKFKIVFKKDDKIIWNKELDADEEAGSTKENRQGTCKRASNNAEVPKQGKVEPRSKKSPIRRKNGESSRENTYDLSGNKDNLYNPGWSMEHIMPFIRMTSVKDAASQYSPPPECTSLPEQEPNSNKIVPQAVHREKGHREDRQECVCRKRFQTRTRASEMTSSRKHGRQSRPVDVSQRCSPHRGNSAPSEISTASTVRAKYSTSRCSKTQRQPVGLRRKCTNQSQHAEDSCSEMSRDSHCSGENSSLHSDDNSPPNSLSLPEWSSENYNPNANFGVETSSPRTFGTGNRIHYHVSPSMMSPIGSFPDIDHVTNSEARLNENFSNQRSRMSNESDAEEEEEVILEPMTPPVLLKTIPQGEPSPRYSAPMSLEKLQKLIEDAKANSRTNVKIKDHNTNFDRDITFDEKPSEEMSNSFIGEYLYKLWKNECLCDVKVTVSNVDFFVHKLVLAAFSNVFCPSTPQPPPTVSFNVPCSTPEAVRQIFTYIYTSTMELRDELLDPILSAAIFMGITEVVEILNEILLKPNLENIETYIEIKSRHGMCSSLADFPHLYRNYFVELSNRDTFFNLKVSELEAVLQDPDVLVCSELDTIGAIANWIKYDPVARISDLPRLLKYVSFESISPKVLATISEKYNYLFTVPGAPQIISEAFKFHALKLETQCGMCSPHMSSPEKLGRKTSKVTLDVPPKFKKNSSTRDFLEGVSKGNKYLKDSYSIPDVNHSSTSIANPLPYKSFPMKESNANAIRLDTQPSGNTRKFRKSSSGQKVGYNDVIHHINMKRNTPIMAATPSGQAIRKSSNMRLHLGGARRPEISGEPQVWTDADGDSRVTHLSGNNRTCNAPRKLRYTPTGHLRSRSRAGKPRRNRHYPVGSFNNNAADYRLLTQYLSLSPPSGQILIAGPNQNTGPNSNSSVTDNDDNGDISNVSIDNDSSHSSVNNLAAAPISSNVQSDSPHLEIMFCDIQEGLNPKSFYGEKQSFHICLSEGYQSKQNSSRHIHNSFNNQNISPVINVERVCQNNDYKIISPKTTRRRMEEKLSPLKTDGLSLTIQPEEHEKMNAAQVQGISVDNLNTFESKASLLRHCNIKTQDQINFMACTDTQRHAITDENGCGNYHLATAVRNTESNNKTLKINDGHHFMGSGNDIPLRQKELQFSSNAPKQMLDHACALKELEAGYQGKPANKSTLQHHDCRRVGRGGTVDGKMHWLRRSTDKSDLLKALRKHSLKPASADDATECNIMDGNSQLRFRKKRCDEIIASQDQVPESVDNSAVPAGQQWTNQSITTLGHDDQASAFKRFQHSCDP